MRDFLTILKLPNFFELFHKKLELSDYYESKLMTCRYNLLFRAKFHKIDDNLNVGVYGIVHKMFRVFIET